MYIIDLNKMPISLADANSDWIQTVAKEREEEN
jgi:hypothetical protein